MSLRAAWSAVREAGTAWAEVKATRLSAAVAFYAILSVTPLFVIAVAIAGAAFGREAAAGALTDQLRGLLGDAGAEVALTALASADKPRAGALATVIGVVILGAVALSRGSLTNTQPLGDSVTRSVSAGTGVLNADRPTSHGSGRPSLRDWRGLTRRSKSYRSRPDRTSDLFPSRGAP